MFRRGEVNGVTFTATKKLVKVSISLEKLDRKILYREIITFDDEDANDLTMSHNDAPVITLCILNTNDEFIVLGRSSITSSNCG